MNKSSLRSVQPTCPANELSEMQRSGTVAAPYIRSTKYRLGIITLSPQAGVLPARTDACKTGM